MHSSGRWPPLMFRSAHRHCQSERDLTDLCALSSSNWQALAAEAVASRNDHKIKLLYSAQEEARAYGDAQLYRAALARYLGRLDP